MIDAEAEQYGWDRSIRPGLDNHIALSMVEAEVVPMDEDPPPEDNNDEDPPPAAVVDAPRPVEVPAPAAQEAPLIVTTTTTAEGTTINFSVQACKAFLAGRGSGIVNREANQRYLDIIISLKDIFDELEYSEKGAFVLDILAELSEQGIFF